VSSWKTKREWENKIKMALKRLVARMEGGWNWLRIRSDGRFCICNVETSGSITTESVDWFIMN
jgi:superoxide dismutase